jgi:ferredoxin, 2Fe-2S
VATITYITYNGVEYVIDVKPGFTVMEGAVRNDVPGIDAECGGACACATCHVYLDEAWRNKLEGPSPCEASMLEGLEKIGPGSRLSCQIKITECLHGLIVRLPESQE